MVFQVSHYDRFACHVVQFIRAQILIGVLAVTYGLYHLIAAKGLAWVLCVYGGLLLVVNGFTDLQYEHLTMTRLLKGSFSNSRPRLRNSEQHNIRPFVFNHYYAISSCNGGNDGNEADIRELLSIRRRSKGMYFWYKNKL